MGDTELLTKVTVWYKEKSDTRIGPYYTTEELARLSLNEVNVENLIIKSMPMYLTQDGGYIDAHDFYSCKFQNVVDSTPWESVKNILDKLTDSERLFLSQNVELFKKK